MKKCYNPPKRLYGRIYRILLRIEKEESWQYSKLESLDSG